MKSNIISTTSDSISSGGTVTGDLTVEGDFVVEGGGSLSVDAAVTGNVSIVNDDNLQLKLDCHHATDDKEATLHFRKSGNTAASPSVVVENESYIVASENYVLGIIKNKENE